MGTANTSFKLFLSVSILLLCVLLCSASERSKITGKNHHLDRHKSHTIQLTSLLPSSACTPSTKATKTKASLQVVHKHWPCSQLNQDKTTISSDHSEILRRDEARVKSIHTKLSKINTHRIKQSHSAVLPAKDGRTLGTGNYFVTVGIGTPRKDFTLIFDTGSDLTWTQCEPCAGACYSHKEPIFNPSHSSSYSNVSCSSTLCRSLSSVTGKAGSCSSSTCVYRIKYGDSSFSTGFFAKETLTLTNSDVFEGFLFGCGGNNQGLFGGAASLLGLGRDNLSFSSQTASTFNKIFSHCLPTSSSSTGHLSFGPASVPSSVKFTPLSTVSQGSSFYGLDITAITVAGQKLTVPVTVFSTAGAIIDSGTVITRLPPKAYAALRTSFRSKMAKYPQAAALSILDTCYDLSNYTTVTIPKIGLVFRGGVDVEIDSTGILYASKMTQVCLAFASNRDDSSVAIFGNVQQKTFDIIYDIAGGRVGFAPGGCD